MNKRVKYTFDTEFSRDLQDAHRVHTSVSAKRYSDADIQALKDAAFEEGKLAGAQDASAAAAEETARAAALVVEHARQIFETLEQEAEKYQAQAASLALLIARKLASGLIAREPAAEIEALLSSILMQLPDEPRIVVRLHESNLEPVKEQVERLTLEAGFEGRVILLGDPEITQTSCTIEWADGGLEWDAAQTEAQAEEAVANYLAAAKDATSQPSVDVG